jgi:glycosyltransferase involved in cell wall biosynthesis
MALIGLDARMAGRTPTGLGTYATCLTRALVARDRTHSYLIIRGPAGPSPIAVGPNLEEIVLPGDLDTPRNLIRGREISRLGLDLYHSLHHFLPPALRVPRVVLSLHDLIWIEHSDLIKDGRFGRIHNVATHLFALGAMRYAVSRADAIVASSAYTRSRALAYYGLDARRITVVHLGVDGESFPPRVEPAIPDRPPYFVVLGNTRPYKNIPAALKAFASCARARPELELVIAGRGDSIATLRPLARALGIERRVQFAGLLLHSDLLRLLHGAAALIFPSFVEGFGFPVLEAMSAGCPVIASRAPTLMEIAGGAALFCEAADPEEFAAAMLKVVDDSRLADGLRASGRERAKHFSWDRCAAGTLAVYQQLL